MGDPCGILGCPHGAVPGLLVAVAYENDFDIPTERDIKVCQWHHDGIKQATMIMVKLDQKLEGGQVG